MRLTDWHHKDRVLWLEWRWCSWCSLSESLLHQSFWTLSPSWHFFEIILKQFNENIKYLMKVNKVCEADSPKNDKLVYSRKQPKDPEATTEELNCAVDAYTQEGCGQFPPEGEMGFPL